MRGTSPWAGFLAVLVAASAWWATPALASDPLPGGAKIQTAAELAVDDVQRSEDLERWRGRSCPLGGCARAPRSKASTPIAFGAAAGGFAWLARRRASRAS